jgi:hypothetical protein
MPLGAPNHRCYSSRMNDSPEAPESTPFDEAGEVPERALRIYARLWQFETWLRRMVYVELRALLGNDWSKSIAPNDKAFDSDKYLKHMPTPEMNALSYAPLSQLTKLVGENWQCFEPYLPPRPLWDAKLAEIAQIRHRIAHFRIGHVDDHARLLQFLRDIDKGFWTFCTSYNDADPILPQSDDPVTTHFLSLDPLPWSEIQPGKWARIGHVDKSPVVGMTVQVLTRPWAAPTRQVDGTPGHLYDFALMAHERKFDYGRLLEATRRLHPDLVHVCLDTFEDTLRLTIPTVLGSAAVIALMEEVLERARSHVGRSRNPVAPDAERIAAEWPEYVLGPKDALTFLAPDMPCSFFNV